MLYRLCLIFVCVLWVVACDEEGGGGGGLEDTAVVEDTSGGVDGEDSGSGQDGEDTTESPTPEQAMILGVEEGAVWTVPGLVGEVHVVRTEMGRPHIYAENRLDLARALGFIVARDRFFVMDLQRRLAQGTISQLLGELALDSDIEARITGMKLATERVLAGMSAEDAAYFDAYAEGINAYIAHVERGELPEPSELRIATRLLFGSGTKPYELMKPFDRKSLAAMVAVIAYQTNFEGGDVGNARNFAMLPTLFEGAPLQDLRREGARIDAWEYQAPSFPVATTAGFGIEIGSSGPDKDFGDVFENPNKPLTPSLRSTQFEQQMLNRAADRLDRLDIRLGRREPENFGSNTWAVASSHTATGEALVAGDGHLSLYVPSLMYQIGMDTKVFGDGDIQQAGLLITSLPLLAVGTNGKVAWSQVNPVADITDWYREELLLGADGLPASSLFQGQQRPLIKVDESYDIAEVPGLQSVARTEVWPRWTTFDGRMLFDIEGRTVTADEPLNSGEARVRLADRFVVPGDVDSDGIVTAVSFDYTAFDITGYVSALTEFTRADDVYDFQEATKGLVGNMLYTCAADMDGNILFSAYQGVPCRGYLGRDAEGKWLPGADPSMLLDGTTYGGFSIPTLPDGKVDESKGATDPYLCAVPFNETPQAINPDQGYLVNANNQPAPIHSDGFLYDDPWYIGGPWYATRADSIDLDLQAATQQKTASIEVMSQIQANTKSRYGEALVPDLLTALSTAKTLSTQDPTSLAPHEQRLAALYTAHAAAFDEVATRLGAWQFNTPSGVETFYRAVAAGESDAAVATMIFNAWMPRLLQKTFDDEGMGAAFRFSSSRAQLNLIRRMLESRGPENALQLASWYDQTQESIFFDVLSTPDIERSEEIMLDALAAALTFLESPPHWPRRRRLRHRKYVGMAVGLKTPSAL